MIASHVPLADVTATLSGMDPCSRPGSRQSRFGWYRKQRPLIPTLLVWSRLLLTVGIFLGLSQVNAEKDHSTYAYGLSVTDGELYGPAADWLWQHAEQARFILLGEAHDLAEVPRIVNGLHAGLCERTGKPWHLALEMGEWTADHINAIGIEQATSSIPFSIAFDGDGELDLIGSALSRGARIIGLDQELNAVHPLQRLFELAPDPETKLAAGEALQQSIQMQGEFLRTDQTETLATLRTTFQAVGALTGEAKQILDAIATSNAIYVDYRAQRYYENAAAREQLMKQLLVRAAGETLPDGASMVIKLGGAHIIAGIGPNQVRTLGNFALEWAESRNESALNIAIWGLNPTRTTDLLEDLAPEHDYVLVDCRTLRPQWVAGALTAVDLPVSAKEIFGYDAVLLIRNPTSAAETRINAAKTRLLESLKP